MNAEEKLEETLMNAERDLAQLRIRSTHLAQRIENVKQVAKRVAVMREIAAAYEPIDQWALRVVLDQHVDPVTLFDELLGDPWDELHQHIDELERDNGNLRRQLATTSNALRQERDRRTDNRWLWWK